MSLSDDLFGTCESSAVLSACGRYRYELTRRWGDGPLLEWVMLNPSTADADSDDPTIRRCIGFARHWGYGAIVVHNLYAFRATNPEVLVNLDDPIGPLNAMYLSADRSQDDCTIAAWGANAAALGWWNGYPYDITDVMRGRKLYCLGTTLGGAPRHPLYVRGDATPQPWTPPAKILEGPGVQDSYGVSRDFFSCGRGKRRSDG